MGASAESAKPAAGRESVTTADYSAPEPRYSKPHHFLIEPCSDPEIFYSPDDPLKTIAANNAFHAACRETANDIVAAVPLWRDTMAVLRRKGTPWAQGDIPTYIGEELALRAAGIESDMGRLERNKGTYKGLYQFSPTNKQALLFKQMDYMLEILNTGRENIPVLKNLKVSRITKRELLSDPVYYDHTVQVFLKMTSAYVSDQKHAPDPDYNKLASWEKMALGYLSHLLPVVENFFLRHHDCDHKVNQFTYSVKGRNQKIARKIFRLNSGMFERDGKATAHDILSRFEAITTPYLKGFAPEGYRDGPGQLYTVFAQDLSSRKARIIVDDLLTPETRDTRKPTTSKRVVHAVKSQGLPSKPAKSKGSRPRHPTQAKRRALHKIVAG
ncbi:MAG: hypothetical protein M3N08_09955 [Pseudomonadota bacterium]|nr:hypothetical protein [Pseudomonadota bacterium]